MSERNWRVDTFVGRGCVWGIGDADPACAGRMSQLDEALLRAEPYAVLIATMGNSGEDAEEARVTAARGRLEQIAARGTRVIVIADNPTISEEAAQCVVDSNADPAATSRCSTPEQSAFPRADPLVMAAEGTPARVVDLRNYYCRDGACPAAIGGVIVYRDRHHLTVTYAKTLGPFIADRLAEEMR